MDSGVAGLLGALIGGIISWFATWSIEVRRDRRQARNLALAAASEIDAALEMVSARNWRQEFVTALALAEKGIVDLGTIHVRDDYLPMCRAAMAHAGVISRELSVDLARFITLADALTSDLKRMAEHSPGTYGALFAEDDAEGAARVYESLIKIIDSAFVVGTRMVTLVDKMYPKEISGYVARFKGAWNIIAAGSL
ncbi:hypothetical protein [Luteimonas panaciterrae]|uniref:hypothetical protein n=1 Tax=Luteimonas panaciterrae TaxID=363885 RepID=UPI001CF95EAC|nr:hypothetical protein [Luteimonas panaciterrae]